MTELAVVSYYGIKKVSQVLSVAAPQADDPASLEQFIIKAPKADLHIHTSGSLTAEFVYERGKDIDWNDAAYPDAKKLKAFQEKYNIDLNEIFKLPKPQAIAKLNEVLTFTEENGNLLTYLDKMVLGHRILYNSPQAYEALAYDIAIKEYDQSNVRYLELRFAVVKPPLTIAQIIESIQKGLLRAQKDRFGLKTAMIVCVNKNATPAQAQEIVDEMIKLRQKPEYKEHLIGLDTANSELILNSERKPVGTFDPKIFEKQFACARAAGIFITNHAGEDYMSLEDGLLAIENSVLYLGAIRIGHALALGVDPGSLAGKIDKYGKVYDSARIAHLFIMQDKLAQLLIDRGVTIEVCLSSNTQTSPDKVPNLKEHPLAQWVKKGLKVTLATDNFVTSNTTLTQEYLNAAETFGLTKPQVEQMLKNGLDFQYK